MKRINVSELANVLQAYKSTRESYENAIKNNDKEEEERRLDWVNKHTDKIEEILKPLPRGSGIDSIMKFDQDQSNSKKLVFSFSFHHMDQNGYYNGWTSHELILTPSFTGIDMRITGRDRNDVKEYLYGLFSDVFYMNHLYQLNQSPETIKPVKNNKQSLIDREAEKWDMPQD